MLAAISRVVALNSFRASANGIFNLVNTIALFIWCAGGMCGLIGMLRLNALGQNPVARAAMGDTRLLVYGLRPR